MLLEDVEGVVKRYFMFMDKKTQFCKAINSSQVDLKTQRYAHEDFSRFCFF